MTFLVYRATCNATGKAYVGCTRKGLPARRSEHERNARSGKAGKFYDALRKHGAGAFAWEVLATYPNARAMFLGERHLIRQHRTDQLGYNTTSGGHEGQMTLVDRYYIHRARYGAHRRHP